MELLQRTEGEKTRMRNADWVSAKEMRLLPGYLPSLYQTLIDFGEDSTIHPRVTLFPKGTPTIWLSTVTVGATRKKKRKKKKGNHIKSI
jgi:hypothetical protein